MLRSCICFLFDGFFHGCVSELKLHRFENLADPPHHGRSSPLSAVDQVKSGEIPMDKVPYMQRGGAWDNSDLTKKAAAKMAARKEVVVNNNKVSKKIVPKKWSETDKAYANVRNISVFRLFYSPGLVSYT